MTRGPFVHVLIMIACLVLTASAASTATSHGDSPAPGISPAASGRDLRLPSGKSALRVGDALFAFMPGEIMLKLGEELRDQFGRPHLLNVTLALDAGTSYVVPQVYFDEGGYEPTATRLAPAAYVELREKMISLLTSVGLAPRKPGA